MPDHRTQRADCTASAKRWLATAIGRGCRDVETLGTRGTDQENNLESRLRIAFEAGWTACDKHLASRHQGNQATRD